MDNRDNEKPIPIILDGRYILKEKIGSGSFGQIFIAICKQTGSILAVKLERRSVETVTTLGKEAKLLGELNGQPGFPTVYRYGYETDYNYMAISLLGNDVEKLFKQCTYKFSLKTVLMIIDQLITRVEVLHNRGYLHRDLKPENFCISKDNPEEINLIDFGLSRSYKDVYGKHIPCSQKRGLMGTARYASINNHQGIEQSRRDDLETLGYNMVYLMKGKLPWQNMRARNKHEKYQKIADMKMGTPLMVLCKDLPVEFSEYLGYVKRLEYEDTPDYEYLRNLFRDLFFRSGYEFDFNFDWISTKQRSVLASLHHMKRHSKAQTPKQMMPNQSKETSIVMKDSLNENKISLEISETHLRKCSVQNPSAFKDTNNSMNQVINNKKESFEERFNAHSNKQGFLRKTFLKGNTVVGAKFDQIMSNNSSKLNSDSMEHSSKVLNISKSKFDDDDEIPAEITFKTSPTLKIQQTQPLTARTKTSYYANEPPAYLNPNTLHPGTARTETRKRTFIRTFSAKDPKIPFTDRGVIPPQLIVRERLVHQVNQAQIDTHNPNSEENLNESYICEQQDKIPHNPREKIFVVRSKNY